MNRWLKIAVGLLVGILLVVYIGGSWFFANVIVGFNQRTLAEDQARRGYTYTRYDLPEPELFHIERDDGIRLEGWFFDNELAGDCGMVLLHGHTSTRYGSLHFTPLFWDKGCDLVVYDARHHGNSDGDYGTYGYHEKGDAVAMVEWLMARTDLEMNDIGLMGVSYGAATALQAGPLLPDIAFVAADSPYQDLKTIVTEQGEAQYGGWVQLFVPTAFAFSEVMADYEADEVSPMMAAAETTAPIFLSHSIQDEFTKSAHSEAIFSQIGHERAVLHLNDWGASHGRDLLVQPELYEANFEEFLEMYVPDFGVGG
ncbi:MAG TPA: alpha/beta fold hydrolase [Anaerolineae bacterium]|nr:alpha/beta fold hydrolase [Anaerolineae bacterium]